MSVSQEESPPFRAGRMSMEGSMETKQRVISAVNLIKAVESHELSLIEAGFDINNQKVSECTDAVTKYLAAELDNVIGR